MPDDFRTCLPKGEWIIFGSMPQETTPANFCEWLREVGFDITPDRISVRKFDRRCSAVVSFPHSEFAFLLNWAINGKKFNGLNVEAQPCAKAARTR